MQIHSPLKDLSLFMKHEKAEGGGGVAFYIREGLSELSPGIKRLL